MAWWFDEYSKYKGFSPACVTGEAACQSFNVLRKGLTRGVSWGVRSLL